MESILRVCQGPYVLWKTAKADENSVKKSSVFGLFGATWHLEMNVENHDIDFLYTIVLNRRGEETPEVFSLLITVEGAESIDDGDYDEEKFHQTIACRENIFKEKTVLWQQYESMYMNKIIDFGQYPYVTVICLVTAMPGSLKETVQTDSLLVKHLQKSSYENLNSLSGDLGHLLEDKVIPDIKLRCGDETVAAHRAILAARSPVFRTMFQTNMSESNTGEVDICDIDLGILQKFLEYVYSGRISDLPDEDLPSIFAACDKYEVSALRKICSERMISNMTRENCFSTLILADAYTDIKFKTSILEFILNRAEILESEEFLKFSKQKPELSNEVFRFVFLRKRL